MGMTENSGSHDRSPARDVEDAPAGQECECGSETPCADPVRVGPRLFEGRRKFLIGGLGVSAFAVTLASRPALAGGNGGGVKAISALCSPVGSHTQSQLPCVGSHCDYYCNNGKHWQSDCYKTLQSCGFSASTGCNVGLTLKSCLTGSYQSSSYHPNGMWGGQGWFGSFGNSFNYGQGSSYNKGWWNYKSGSDTGSIETWLACGYLNAKYQSSSFGYTTSQFVSACNTVLTQHSSSCTLNIKSTLCKTISSCCQQNRSPLPSYTCGGIQSLWTL